MNNNEGKGGFWPTAFFAALLVLCCGIPLLIVSGVSFAFLRNRWPMLAIVLAVIGLVGFVWYPWWASNNALELFWGQVNEDVRIVPFEKYHEAAKTAMDREVFAHEFADPQALKDEFIERTNKETLEPLMAKIPQDFGTEKRAAVC
jgi:hypothetical protein